MSRPKILETTIRDGSYEVGFHFTRRDVASLAALLDHAGFSFIEVGHGNGLGGEVFGDVAAATDEEYLETARRAVTRAKLGALLGFTQRSDDYIRSRVELAARCGLDYIRMGMVPRRSDEPIIVGSIELAKSLGLTVSVNFMRTYCATPAEIEERTRRALERGVDWVYVVDSAGGMQPEQVATYVRAIGEAGPAEIGYHGHNNTQRAFANSVAAIDAGATMVDTSLQGLGRATGNAQTELVLVALQEHYNSEREIDRNLVFKLARRVVRPLVERGFDPTNVLAGALNVHSSSLKGLGTFASEYGIELDDVLADAGRRAGEQAALDRRDLPEEIVVSTCQSLVSRARSAPPDLNAIAAHCAEHRPAPPTDVGELVAALSVASRRDRQSLALVVVPDGWGFEGFGVWRDRGRALGIVPAGRVESCGPLAELPIEEVFAPDSAELGPLETTAGVSRYDFAAAVAEAAVLGCGIGRSLAIAVADPALRAAIVGRVGGRENVAVIEDAASAAIADELIVGGELGADALETLAPRLGSDHAVTPLGQTPISGAAIAAIERAGCTLRIACFFPLLLARRAVSMPVQLGQSQNGERAVVIGSEVVDVEGDTLLGQWQPLAARRAEVDPAARVALERRRLEDLIE